MKAPPKPEIEIYHDIGALFNAVFDARISKVTDTDIEFVGGQLSAQK
jgi:hypothetical protein